MSETESSSSFVPPPPRAVRVGAYLGPKEQFLILFGGIWALVGLGLAIGFTLGGGNPIDDVILDLRSAPAEAESLRVTPTGSSANNRPVYRIEFEFRDQAGTTHSARCISSDPELIERARSQPALPAQYDPSSPTRARIEGAKRSLFGLFTLLPLGIGLIGLVILYRGVRSLLNRKQLLTHGSVAHGRVESVTLTNTSINRRRLIEIRYSFSSMTGPAEGRFRGFLEPAVGSEVAVLYDLDDPNRSLLVQPGDFQ
jgi:hypothetical protein